MKIRAFLMFAFIVAITVGAIAQRPATSPSPNPTASPTPTWKLIDATLTDKNDFDTLYFYRSDSILEIAPHTYKVWVKTLNLKENTEKQQNRYYSLHVWELRCRSRESRLTRLMKYDANGKLLSDDNDPDSTFTDVVPETMGETTLKTICAVVEKGKPAK